MKPQAELKVVMVPTDDLVMYEGNAKLHPEGQVDQIASSIEEFNFADPIAAWHNDEGESVIVEGHGRLMAARKLGIEKLPVIYLDYLSDEQRRAYMLVHNQTTMNSGFDSEILASELASIEFIDMSDFGFDVEANTDTIGIDDIDLWPEFQREDIFATELGEANNYVVLQFHTTEEWEKAIKVFDLEKVVSLDKNPNVRRKGIGRVIDGAEVLGRMDAQD